MEVTKGKDDKKQWNCPEFIELSIKRTEEGVYDNRPEDSTGLDVDSN